MLNNVSGQVLEELNIKEIRLLRSESEVSDLTVNANMALVGPKYGQDTPRVLSALSKMDAVEVTTLVSSGRPVSLGEYVLEPNEVVVNKSDKEGFSVVSDSAYTVAVTTEVTQQLAEEGMARELIHRIQNMRRSAGFDIADHIETFYHGPAWAEDVLDIYGDYIRQETLSDVLVKGESSHAVELYVGQHGAQAYEETHKLEGEDVQLIVRRL